MALGDFQTPPGLVAEVLDALRPRLRDGYWTRILEPTCGLGHFLEGAGRVAGRAECCGIEIQPELLDAARTRLCDGVHENPPRLIRADLFQVDLRRLEWATGGPLLVLGNLPWVTTAALGSIGEANRPVRDDVRAESMSGLAAKTGASNFDISEYFLLKLLNELGDQPLTLAMLCKTSVARKVWAESMRSGRKLRSSCIKHIDARRWFQAAVDASLFLLELGEPEGPPELRVFDALSATESSRAIGLTPGGQLVADRGAYEAVRFADGACPLNWRQGVKHDAAPVLELVWTGLEWRNGLGESVEVEPGFRFPLKKSADLLHPGRPGPTRALVLPELGLSGQYAREAAGAERLRGYLGRHAARFRARRSSIYKARSDFAIFGIGPYSFAPWKLAVSGLSKKPEFVPLAPVDGEPVMLDDTSYFVPCRDAEQAAILSMLLNHEVSSHLLTSLIFPDAKRPVTRGLLQRLDLGAILGRVGPEELEAGARRAFASLDPEAARQADGRPLAWSAALVDDWRPETGPGRRG